MVLVKGYMIENLLDYLQSSLTVKFIISCLNKENVRGLCQIVTSLCEILSIYKYKT